MEYIVAADSDIGISKEINQDSICIKTATAGSDSAALVLVCDGMGGLSKGEVASAAVINAFSDWFDNRLADEFDSWDMIEHDVRDMLQKLNSRIAAYGQRNRFQLGTTATGMIVINSRYMIFHIGDTRIYKISYQLNRLTEDHTFINREIKLGTMTPEQAKSNSRRNALTRCIGVIGEMSPDITFGNVESGANYMICSDGFRNVLTDEEILENLSPRLVTTKTAMKIKMRSLIETVKERGEKDNISAAMFRAEF